MTLAYWSTCKMCCCLTVTRVGRAIMNKLDVGPETAVGYRDVKMRDCTLDTLQPAPRHVRSLPNHGWFPAHRQGNSPEAYRRSTKELCKRSRTASEPSLVRHAPLVP